MSTRYPYSRQQITDDDVAAVATTLRGPFLTQGPTVEAFERAFAALQSCEEVVACANGTAALHLSYMAANLGPERGLLTSPITFLATANAARMIGAPVVFADVDPLSGNITPETVSRALASAQVPIAAVAAVHLAGLPCDMVGLREVAARKNLVLIEDACHAVGAVYDGNTALAGSCRHSDLAVFSFHAIKHIAMGEGGAVCTNDATMAHRMRLMRTHGLSRDPDSWEATEDVGPWYYEMQEVGYNYRLTDFQASLGLSQLGRLPQSLARRREIAALYNRLLSGVPHLRVPSHADNRRNHAWHLYAIAIDFDAIGKSRSQVMKDLAERGVGTQVHYIPLYRQPYYRRLGHLPLPGAEAYYRSTLSIPMYPQLSDDDVAVVCEAVRAVVSA